MPGRIVRAVAGSGARRAARSGPRRLPAGRRGGAGMTGGAPPLVVGLTGGIGAGKSTCSRTIADAGIPVFDCDAEVAGIYRTTGFVADIEAEFGALGADPKRAMAARVMTDDTALDRLYGVIEPRLKARWGAFLERHAGWPAVVVDAPLLLEKGWDAECDIVVCVMTDRPERLRRTLSRPGMTPERFGRVDARQAGDDVRRAKADVLIDGNQPPAEVRRQVLAVLGGVARIYDARTGGRRT